MITSSVLKEWLASLPEDTLLAIDEGGLTLLEVGGEGEPAYIEVGGEGEPAYIEIGMEPEEA